MHGTRMMVLLLVQGCLFPEHFPLSRKEGPHIRSAAKCKLFSLSDLSTGPSILKSSVPHFEILRAPIGDAISVPS